MTNSHIDSEERFEELWTDYLEGELGESGFVELQELLAAHDFLLKRAADYYRTHRLLGFIATEQDQGDEQFVREVMQKLPDDGDKFSRGVMQQVESQGSIVENSVCEPSAKNSNSIWRRAASQSGWLVALLSVIALPIVWYAANNPVAVPEKVGERPSGNVRFASLSHAQFFGELSPPVQSPLTPQRDYVLVGGFVKLAFPRGASAIVEGPAVFRVLSDECLALDVGHCSVYAPKGAEGFRVETPVTRVVDRGTRFSINVSENSETEVQVIEGIADVYRHLPESDRSVTEIPDEATFELRLTDHEACLLESDKIIVAEPTEFKLDRYRKNLPDRIVSYSATTADAGGVEFLTTVTVQRAGEVIHYPIEQLIPVDLTYFKAGQGLNCSGHLAGGASLSKSRIQVLSDTALNTGIINPGGSQQPLIANPIMRAVENENQLNTPGMALRFRTPVKNGPGPDVVFFELQTLSNPPEGDAFHVSPLRFAPGRKSHTIQSYDLTMLSPESQKISQFYLYRFEQSITTLVELQTTQCVQRPKHLQLHFHAITVGIDLSDLGYLPGEQVEGLFIQDAQDDGNLVDPVFIGGLP